MNKGEKLLLIIGVIFIALIIILFLILNKNNDEIKSTQYEVNSEISRLNSNYIFTLQSIINDYYNKIANNDKNGIINILDDEYINSENIYKIINNDYTNPSFIPEKILYNEDNRIKYYFINGYLIDVDMLDNIHYEKSVNYLVIIKNNKYVIRPLDSNIDIDVYSRNFNFKDINIKNNEIITSSVSEKNKIIMYIANFMSLYNVDKEKSYNMLGEKTKKKYTYEEFVNRNINVSTNIFAYAKEDNVYKIKDKMQKSIEITENYIMDYKIDF